MPTENTPTIKKSESPYGWQLSGAGITGVFGVLRISVMCLIFLVGTLIPGMGRAQESYTVSGTIYNPRDQQPMPGATTVILSVSDSTMLSGTTTDPEGYFVLKNVESGSYILKVSYIGHKPMYKPFSVDGRSMGLGRMLLKESSTQLQAVEVVADRAEFKQQGDTTVYFGSAVKVGHGSTAGELIEKMPGMNMKNGSLQAQGEDVLEIMVDGKRFFEGDLETALKMLPAESVQNVELYNYKSERSRLTGIDEGGGGKSINIVTKEAYGKSMFGRAYGGAGASGEYQGGGNLNLLNEDKRLTVLYQSNNINQQNFAQEDVSEISGGRMSENEGVSNVHTGGLDFSNIMGEQSEVSGSYFFNVNDNLSDVELVREYLPGDNGNLEYIEDSEYRYQTQTHNFNLRVRNDLDEQSTVLFQPQLYVTNSNGQQFLESQSLEDGLLINESMSSVANTGKSTDFSAPIDFTHRFNKSRRTLTVRLAPSYNTNGSESRLSNDTRYFDEMMAPDTIRQQGNTNAISYRLNGGIHYSEPLGEKSTIFLRYQTNYDVSESDERVFKDGFAGTENVFPDSLLSNQFESRTTEHRIEPEYMLRSGNHHLRIGLEYNTSRLISDQLFPLETSIDRQFNAILPNLSWRLNFKGGNRMRLSYRASNRAPNAQQLQTVPDNTNPMRQYAGNSQLNQEYRHSLSLNYSGMNMDKGSVFLLGFNFSVIDDFYANTITTANADTLIAGRIQLQKGGQLVQTQNIDGFVMAGVYTSFDNDIDFLKSNFSVGLNLNYTRMPGMINGEMNWSNMPGGGINLGLTSNISEKIDFSIRTESHFERAINSLQPEFNNQVFRQETGASLQWNIAGGLTFNSDVNHQLLRGNSELFNTSILLCNVGVGYKFLKNKQAEFRLTIFDLFNNNSSIRRSINDVYTDTRRTNVLNRYGMLTFVYRLSTAGQ